MSDGHPDAGAGKERVIDFGDLTDDGEVELNLPREDDMERDPPGEDVRDLPGATASGTSVINQEERYRLETPNGARPKWTRPGRPLPIVKEPRSPGAGATVGADDSEMNGVGWEFRARCCHRFGRTNRVPECRLLREWMLTDVAPETRLPDKGTRLASHVFAEARDKDVNSDRRDFPWSPENVLVDTVARLQRDLNDMRAESRYLRTPRVRDTSQNQTCNIYIDEGAEVCGDD